MSATTDRRPLTRSRVVSAALDIIDDAGLEALSMRKLGAALGVEAMSLYNHVESKDDLLTAVAERLLELVELPRSGYGDWEGQVVELCYAVRHMGLDHPRAFSLLVTQRHSSFESWGPVLTGFDLVARAGLSDDEAVHVVKATSAFLVGFVLFEINAGARGHLETPCAAAGPCPDGPPLLRRYARARHPDTAEEFAHGLELMVRGIRATVGARRGVPGGMSPASSPADQEDP